MVLNRIGLMKISFFFGWILSMYFNFSFFIVGLKRVVNCVMNWFKFVGINCFFICLVFIFEKFMRVLIKCISWLRLCCVMVKDVCWLGFRFELSILVSGLVIRVSGLWRLCVVFLN